MSSKNPPDGNVLRIGCPKCDAVYTLPAAPKFKQRAKCTRCGEILINTVSQSSAPMLALSLAVLILVVAATFFPFLTINASGLTNRVSLLDVATSFQSGILVVVSVSTVLFIVALPALRMALLLYVLMPLELGLKPLHFARQAFRFAQALKAWTMTEIFALGCAVALVKVAGLADLELGVAFWMFMVLSILTLLVERNHCTWSIWRALQTGPQAARR